MKKHLSTIVLVLLFFLGLCLFLYPTFSNVYNEYLNKKLIGDYQEQSAKVDYEAYADEKESARLYNEYRNDPEKLKEFGLTYEEVLNVAGNGIMGYIEIPKINVSLVIFHTLSEDKLQNAIGHMEESSLPIGGENTHCVLAGHTGLPSAKLLTNIDHLDVGDRFMIHVLDEVLTYQVDKIVVVEPHEVDHINVVSGKDHVTLVTCTPYGVNSHRLLVRGVRVDGKQLTDSNLLLVPNEVEMIQMRYLLTISLLVFAVIGFIWYQVIYFGRKRKHKKVVCDK